MYIHVLHYVYIHYNTIDTQTETYKGYTIFGDMRIHFYVTFH